MRLNLLITKLTTAKRWRRNRKQARIALRFRKLKKKTQGKVNQQKEKFLSSSILSLKKN
jgi:hypothetical protein